MNDKDVPRMPDRLGMKITAEDYRRYAHNSYRLKEEARRGYGGDSGGGVAEIGGETYFSQSVTSLT